jgi:hypothetical protein
VGNKSFSNRFKIYTEDGKKRVPWQVLNSTKEIQAAFIKGYYQADGLSANNRCIYDYRNYKTNSATLAQGVLFLLSKVTGQEFNITVEQKIDDGKRFIYYSVNLLSDSSCAQNQKNCPILAEVVQKKISEGWSQRKISREIKIGRNFIRKVQNGYVPTGVHHLLKPINEVKKIIDYPEYDGWLYDLETESGTFHCGVGLAHVHNSPRRGIEFVTQKIAHGAASIKLGLQSQLVLGNLEAKRDWGHAADFVQAMWLMLQQDEPDDYVVATGEAHTVREFCEVSFSHLGLDYREYVAIDQQFFRPTEVDYLLGDSTKARTKLGWAPKISFKELVTEMTDAALDKLSTAMVSRPDTLAQVED